MDQQGRNSRPSLSRDASRTESELGRWEAVGGGPHAGQVHFDGFCAWSEGDYLGCSFLSLPRTVLGFNQMGLEPVLGGLSLL